MSFDHFGFGRFRFFDSCASFSALSVANKLFLCQPQRCLCSDFGKCLAILVVSQSVVVFSHRSVGCHVTDRCISCFCRQYELVQQSCWVKATTQFHAVGSGAFSTHFRMWLVLGHLGWLLFSRADRWGVTLPTAVFPASFSTSSWVRQCCQVKATSQTKTLYCAMCQLIFGCGWFRIITVGCCFLAPIGRVSPYRPLYFLLLSALRVGSTMLPGHGNKPDHIGQRFNTFLDVAGSGTSRSVVVFLS